jgi:protein-S-isoprenylcysteine O-methyltransferase Ste14
MMRSWQVESIGYIISTVSVILLGIVAWQGAPAHGWLRAALFTGVLLAIAGMLLRWYVYWKRHGRHHHKDKDHG